MKYAVVKTGGKQYKVTEGDIIEIEKLDSEKDKEVVLNEVLLYTADGVVKIGTPFLEGFTVKATVVDQIRGEKIRVSKYKSKVRYRRVTGHRQRLTKLKIDSISVGGAKKVEPKSDIEESQSLKVKPVIKKAAKKA